MFKIKATTIYTFIAPIFIFALAISFPGCKSSPLASTDLEFWGVFDDSDVFNKLIADFNGEFPKIKIKYYKKVYSTYEKDLLEAMASGRGPDIFMIHHTWVPKYEDKIWAAPSDLVLIKDIQDNFVDVVYKDFVVDGYVVALPLSVDTLALYYNKDIFNTVGIAQPPETWEEFLDVLEKLTIKDDRDNIIRAGASIGTARNVNRSTDILSLLMLQSGAQMTDQNKTRVIFDDAVKLDNESFYPGQRALEFYTDFANPLKSSYTWNTRMHYSIDAFYEGTAAMIFNYSYHLPTIKAKSPYLNFGVARMPQIESSEKDINYANYWGMSVSRNSESSEQAWEFINWLVQKESSKKYLEETKKPTARRDLVDWQKDDKDVGIFAEQSLSAQSWYQVDSLSIENIFADMIESVVLGEETIGKAIDKSINQINLLMK